MTSDSKLFPPRTKWEEQGYRPDEYSRWLKGDWRPIAELWAELGIDPTDATSSDVVLEEWLFDTSAGPERRAAEARFVHGHLLKPGDVARTPARLRCAQPPYDTLPIPRADIPAGIILSREADAWIREELVEDVALPLYQGSMIYIDNWSLLPGCHDVPQAELSEPGFLIRSCDWSGDVRSYSRLVFRDIARATDKRTLISTVIPNLPCGNKVPLLSHHEGSDGDRLVLQAVLGTVWADWTARQRVAAAHINWHVASSFAVLKRTLVQSRILELARTLLFLDRPFAPAYIRTETQGRGRRNTASTLERNRLRVILNVLVASAYGLTRSDVAHVLRECDHQRPTGDLDARGFWRVDKDKDPELRHTVLTLIAFHDLEAKIREHGGDRDAGIAAFLAQNHGEGWMLPETLRLADYGLGHDERAQQAQPVASRLGPRFYDWQLAQSAEESWRECRLHARNLLGEAGYQKLLSEIEAEKNGAKPASSAPATAAAKAPPAGSPQGSLFG